MGTASSTTPWERLFLECDLHGRVLWMNDRARKRLGHVESPFTALPALHVPQASRLLQSVEPGAHQELVSSPQVWDRLVPVHLVRLLALAGRVVLSAEVRARASDGASGRSRKCSGCCWWWQSNATRNYFRLLRPKDIAGRPRRLVEVGRRRCIRGALEMERTRIARELHSGAGQTLAGIKVNLCSVNARHAGFPHRRCAPGLRPDQSVGGSGAERDPLGFPAAASSGIWQRLDLAGRRLQVAVGDYGDSRKVSCYT